MLSFFDYESAVSPALRLRNALREFWDFSDMEWVAEESSVTRIDYAESDNGDGTSFYAVDIALPPGGPFALQAVLPSGEVIASDSTALDAQMSSAPEGPTATAIREELDANSARLAMLDAAVSSRSTYAGGPVASVTGSVQSVAQPVTVGTNNDKTGYGISAASVLAIWNQGTAAIGILANTFGAKLRDLVLGADNRVKISADPQDLSATLKVNAKVVEDKTGYALTAVYDPAKSAASQASVTAIPTDPLLSGDGRLDNLDAPVSAIPTDPLRAGDYVAPNNAGIAAVLDILQDTAHGLTVIDAELEAVAVQLSGAALSSDLQTVLERLTLARAELMDNLELLTGAPGLTPEQADILTEARDEARRARQMQTNKAVIANDGLSVTIYADDGATELWTFAIPDNKHRLPLP